MGQATGGEKPLGQGAESGLLEQARGGQAPLVWAPSSGAEEGLSVMWCLLCDLQVAGTDCSRHLRGQREAWPAITGYGGGL